MQANPIVEKQKEEEAIQRAKAAYRYPFRVVCVYENSENNDFPIIRDVRDYCNKNNLIFSARQYDHERFEEDICVNRLPAFHIFYKKYIDETTYYDKDPIHLIQVKVWAFQDEERAKERARQRRQERWDSMKESLKTTFSLNRFKKKPALDLDASLSHKRDDVQVSQIKNEP
jgi:hypothetical protein